MKPVDQGPTVATDIAIGPLIVLSAQWRQIFNNFLEIIKSLRKWRNVTKYGMIKLSIEENGEKQRMAISACWIVKNEEDTIIRSIQSLKAAVDDIVVVDTGSTDNTVQVARALGARVEHFTWIDDFAAARNYAMGLTKNELVLFLDADEWFEPALTREDGMAMERHFHNHPTLEIGQFEMAHLTKSGDTLQITEQPRLLKKIDDFAYMSPIHEYYGPVDGRLTQLGTLGAWKLLHSGYAEDVQGDKADRNIAMMLDELKENADNVSDVVRTCMYLLREYMFKKEFDVSLPYLQIILRHSDIFKDRLRYRNFVPLGDYVIQYTCSVKDRISRREVREKLFRAQELGYAEYPGRVISPLFYQVNFDLKEDELLKALPVFMEARRKIPEFPTDLYLPSEAQIYASAAFAHDRRGDLLAAFDAASLSLKTHKKFAIAMTPLLLKLMRGQPAQDVILFLNSIFDIEESGQLALLVECTRHEEFLEVYAFYQMKRYKNIGVSRVMQIDLLFTQKRYDDALQAALKAGSELGGEDSKTINAYLAAICVCMDDVNQHRLHASAMPDGARMVEAYYQGAMLHERSVEENEIFPMIYKHIATVAGTDKADRFANIFFFDFPKLVYTSRAPYLLNAWKYEELANRPMHGIAEDDYTCYTYRIHANVYLGNYEAAYTDIRRFLTQYGTDDADLLTGLLVVAEGFEKSGHPLAKEARALYNRHIQYHDALIDVRDVAKSGYAPDDYGKSRTKKLKTVAAQAFLEKCSAEMRERLSTDALLRAYLDAAKVYEEQKVYGMAAQCYGYAHTSDELRAEAAAGLARVFGALGNGAAAKEFVTV